MQTARRLYVYLLVGIGLGGLVAGITLLLTTLLEALGLGGGPAIDGDDQALRERLTLATAMTVVAMPVWIIHWFAAERSVRPGRPNASVERSSDIRGLYFFLALGILLVVAVAAARALIEAGGMALAGDALDFRHPAGDIALLVTSGAAWLYHVSVRTRDWARGTIHGPGAWLPRAYLYLAVFIGLFVMLFGLSDLLDLAGRAVGGDPGDGFTDPDVRWWAHPLTSAIGAVITGGLVWAGHWWYASRLRDGLDARGSLERSSRVRLAFFVGVLVVAAGAAIEYLSRAARVVLEGLTGVGSSSVTTVSSPVVWLIAAMLFALACWLHARWLRGEAALANAGIDPVGARRLEAYPLALVGLAVGAVGVAGLLGMILEVVLGGGQTLLGGDVWQRELAAFLPFAVIGSALWFWQWSRVTIDWSRAPSEESASTVRRTALLIVLAVSILTGIIALGMILYRVFGALFGLDASGDVASGLSTPLAALVVAIGSAVYHGAALRRDQSLHARTEADAITVRPILLRLIAPATATPDELTTVTNALRNALPPGYGLEDDGQMT